MLAPTRSDRSSGYRDPAKRTVTYGNDAPVDLDFGVEVVRCCERSVSRETHSGSITRDRHLRPCFEFSRQRLKLRLVRRIEGEAARRKTQVEHGRFLRMLRRNGGGGS